MHLLVGITAAYSRVVQDKATTVQPASSSIQESQLRFEELKGQLIENESQRTEVNGYINQLSIQLHRYRLRLQGLDERKEELEKELGTGS